VYQGESRLVKNNIQLGELSVKVPRNKKGEESVDVRFSYDSNGVLEVDVTVNSTQIQQHKLIHNTPGQLSEAEITASHVRLAKLKFHPREQEANQAIIARAERLYEGRLQRERDLIDGALRHFEAVLARQNPVESDAARAELEALLTQFEQDRLF